MNDQKKPQMLISIEIPSTIKNPKDAKLLLKKSNRVMQYLRRFRLETILHHQFNVPLFIASLIANICPRFWLPPWIDAPKENEHGNT